MATVFIIILTISQLISFYLIFILNSKMSKFKDLESRQDKMMEEMENAISVYLLEIKEENDRFIHELTKIKTSQQKSVLNLQAGTVPDPIGKEPVEDDLQKNVVNLDAILPTIPKAIAKNAYIQQKKNMAKEQENMPDVIANEKKGHKLNDEMLQRDVSLKDKVLALHQEGKSIEEIAKITQKGKTEIELLLKFQA
nr:hypothetical protein [Bacilli bacterium]